MSVYLTPTWTTLTCCSNDICLQSSLYELKQKLSNKLNNLIWRRRALKCNFLNTGFHVFVGISREWDCANRAVKDFFQLLLSYSCGCSTLRFYHWAVGVGHLAITDAWFEVRVDRLQSLIICSLEPAHAQNHFERITFTEANECFMQGGHQSICWMNKKC